MVNNNSGYFIWASSDFVWWYLFKLYSFNTAIVFWHSKHTALFPELVNKFLCVHSSLNARHCQFYGFKQRTLFVRLERSWLWCCADENETERERTGQAQYYTHTFSRKVGLRLMLVSVHYVTEQRKAVQECLGSSTNMLTLTKIYWFFFLICWRLLRATQNPVEGRMWPAGRSLPTTDLDN